MESKIFADKKTGALVETVSIDDERVSFSSQGGGFVVSMSRADFDAAFVESSLPALYRKFLFTAEWMDHNLPGYTNGARWNGWAIPLVTKEIAAQLAATHSADLSDEGSRFRWDGDSLFYFDPAEGAEFEILPEAVDTEDGVLSLYNFGLGWCWEFAESV